MSSKRTKIAVGLMACLVVLSAGCVQQNYGYQPGPAVVVGPGPIQPTPAPVGPGMGGPGMGMGGPGGMQIVGLGISTGLMVAPDSYLEVGDYLGFQASIWLAQVLALEVGIGTSTMHDTWWDEDFTVVPITFNAIISLPDPMM